jgi:hypothetical protein
MSIKDKGESVQNEWLARLNFNTVWDKGAEAVTCVFCEMETVPLDELSNNSGLDYAKKPELPKERGMCTYCFGKWNEIYYHLSWYDLVYKVRLAILQDTIRHFLTGVLRMEEPDAESIAQYWPKHQPMRTPYPESGYQEEAPHWVEFFKSLGVKDDALFEFLGDALG